MSSISPGPWKIAHTEFSLGWGGQERRIMAELEGFRSRGCAVSLVAPPASQIHERAKAAGLAVRDLPCGKVRFLSAVAGLARWLRQERVAILNTHSSRDGWIGGLAGRIARTPLIIRTRHFDVPTGKAWLSRIVYARLCDHVMTTSPKVTEHFQTLFGLAPDRISTIPTGIDLSLFSPLGPKAAWPTVPGQEQWPLVGMISIIRHAKGHVILLEAIRLLRDQSFPVRCLMVGEGPNQVVVEKRIDELGLRDCVSFTGHREDIPAVLRSLDLLVMPSLHEGIPQVGMQALACKTPVIGSDAGGIPEIIRPNQTGRIVPRENPPALARAMREALTDQATTRQLAEHGRGLVEREHSLETMLNKIETIYRQHAPNE